MTDGKKHLDCGDLKTKCALSEKHLHGKHISLNNISQLPSIPQPLVLVPLFSFLRNNALGCLGGSVGLSICLWLRS